MATDVTAENQYWVHISLDGHELTPHAAQTADEAEAIAARMSAICRVLRQPALTWIVQQPAARRTG
jgi:hypothetical protein